MKLVFEDLIKTDLFASELYKELRKQSKKFDQIVALEQRDEQEGAKSQDEVKKLQKKNDLQSKIEESLNVFSIYKKTLQTQS